MIGDALAVSPQLFSRLVHSMRTARHSVDVAVSLALAHMAPSASTHLGEEVLIPGAGPAGLVSKVAIDGLDSPLALQSASSSTGRASTVAIVPVQGFILQRAPYYGYGVVSIEGLLAVVRALVADETVGAIVLHFHSPGGGVYGVTEAATELRQLRGQKPIVASIDAMAGSAAYWLASQASEVVITLSGEAGSIGVFGIHVDESKRLEEEGRMVTIVYAGRYKVERAETIPLSEEATAAFQAYVDGYHGLFEADVAAGRGVKVSKVSTGFGEGRMLTAKAAVEAGLADRVGGLLDATRRAAQLARRPSLARAQADLLRSQREA